MLYTVKLQIPDRHDPEFTYEVDVDIFVKGDALDAAKAAVKKFTPHVIRVVAVHEQQTIDFDAAHTQAAFLDDDEEPDLDAEEEPDGDPDVEAIEGPQEPGEESPEEEAGDE